ncbi:MAG TPA: rRNA adenine dimethyltransferase family protein [Gaiellales bacterium]|nr:rRNA adenine dimethyltransferase family protein [Gaiellales bacterium]
MAAREHGRRPRLADGQHFLRSPRVAAEIVAAAGVRPGELVLEPGAGFGRLTAPLVAAGARVLAVELDPGLAAGLARRFARAGVEVVPDDVLAVALPGEPYRVLGNLPFGSTTAILRRLLGDLAAPPERVDVVVQAGLAAKRCAPRPTTLLSATWGPWWELTATRTLPASCFDPPPAVDAAILSVRRRSPPLLDLERAEGYRSVVARGFAAGNRPLRRCGLLSPLRWKRFARERGLGAAACARELDLWDWLALAAELPGG